MKQRLAVFLNSKKTFWLLITLNVLSSVAVFIFYFDLYNPDGLSYLALADSMRQGKYTMFPNYTDYLPDTFRNPGYPVFLFLIKLFSQSTTAIKIVQLILYFMSIIMILKVIAHYNSSLVTKNIFLFLLAPSVYIPSFAALVLPEVPMVFFIALYVFLDQKLKPDRWVKYVALGILCGILFEIRPVFLFFPFIKFCIDFFYRRKQFFFFKQIALLLIYMMMMLPFAFWNLKNHKVFKITSIEGGAGQFHLGYWQFKIPGYYDQEYWHNHLPDEVVNFTNEFETPVSLRNYLNEWRVIDSVCSQYLTQGDSANIRQMQLPPWNHIFITYPTQYTLAREKLLWGFAIQDYTSDWKYTLETKAYSAIRLWITGIQSSDFLISSWKEKLVMLYPPFITGIIFLLAIILIPMALIKRKVKRSDVAWLIALLIYYGMIHVPFVIQARYTIPVRLVLLMLIAISIQRLFFTSESQIKDET